MPMAVRPTEAVIDLSAVAHNYRVAVELGGRPGIGIVKADAYGHGAVEVARELVAQGAPVLAVALVEVGAAYDERYDLLVRHRLVPIVFDASHLRGLAEAARAAGVRAAAHL